MFMARYCTIAVPKFQVIIVILRHPINNAVAGGRRGHLASVALVVLVVLRFLVGYRNDGFRTRSLKS